MQLLFVAHSAIGPSDRTTRFCLTPVALTCFSRNSLVSREIGTVIRTDRYIRRQ